MKALLLIDLQRGMCDDDGPAGAAGLAAQVRERGVLESARIALESARATSTMVVHVRLAFDASFLNRSNRSARFADHEASGRFVSGSRETEFRSEVAPLPFESVVDKGSISPFAATGLLERLASGGYDDLALAGVATHLAIESAAREATDRGFAVTVLENACASPDPRVHEHAVTTVLPAFARIATVADFADELTMRSSVL